MIAGVDEPPVITRRPPAPVELRPLDPVVAAYSETCERILWTRTGEPVRAWLHERGFNDELLHANHVGCDPGPELLWRRRGLPHAGLAAVFPAFDQNDQFHYLQARYLDPVDDHRYDNPAGRLGANPRVGFTRPVGCDRAPVVLLVVEGMPDALTAGAAGYRAAGILGAELPDTRVADRIAQACRHRGPCSSSTPTTPDGPAANASAGSSNVEASSRSSSPHPSSTTTSTPGPATTPAGQSRSTGPSRLDCRPGRSSTTTSPSRSGYDGGAAHPNLRR